MNLTYLYLLSPLHTGGTSQEGNVVGIARETHTNFPYLPSSTIRGKLRAIYTLGIDDEIKQILAPIEKIQLFGPELSDLKDEAFLKEYKDEMKRELTQLEQGAIWIGDGSILWFPVASLSHGVIWVSSPLLLQRWQRFCNPTASNISVIPEYSSNLDKSIYLKDAQIAKNQLKKWKSSDDYIPNGYETSIKNILVLPNKHCETLIQMSLWRQVKVKLNDHKIVTDGSFRYEEAIPPDTLMYFTWGTVRQAQKPDEAKKNFQDLLNRNSVLQLGGQESLGRGFVRQWNPEILSETTTDEEEAA